MGYRNISLLKLFDGTYFPGHRCSLSGSVSLKLSLNIYADRKLISHVDMWRQKVTGGVASESLSGNKASGLDIYISANRTI